jgi:hypothetical protein
MSSRLPGKAAEATDLDAFITSAGQTDSTIAAGGQGYPWQDRSVRTDVYKIYNLRLPEPYLLKLKYIAEHTPGSMQQFCMAVLKDAIDAKIAELTR